jgi:hypothetical protein
MALALTQNTRVVAMLLIRPRQRTTRWYYRGGVTMRAAAGDTGWVEKHTRIISYAHALMDSCTHTLIHSYNHTTIQPCTHAPVHSLHIHSYTLFRLCVPISVAGGGRTGGSASRCTPTTWELRGTAHGQCPCSRANAHALEKLACLYAVLSSSKRTLWSLVAAVKSVVRPAAIAATSSCANREAKTRNYGPCRR